MTKLAFVDTETTGLDPDQHEIWEVGLILREKHENGVREVPYHWFLPVDLGRADPYALKIGRFHERYPTVGADGLGSFAQAFAKLTWGAHLVGNVVSFDEERLRELLRANGQCPGWHYHLIDVEPLVVGYLRGLAKEADEAGCLRSAAEYRRIAAPPYKSVELSRAIGVEPPGDYRHTALGDARWAMEMYDKVMS